MLSQQRDKKSLSSETLSNDKRKSKSKETRNHGANKGKLQYTKTREKLKSLVDEQRKFLNWSSGVRTCLDFHFLSFLRVDVTFSEVVYASKEAIWIIHICSSLWVVLAVSNHLVWRFHLAERLFCWFLKTCFVVAAVSWKNRLEVRTFHFECTASSVAVSFKLKLVKMLLNDLHHSRTEMQTKITSPKKNVNVTLICEDPIFSDVTSQSIFEFPHILKSLSTK